MEDQAGQMIVIGVKIDLVHLPLLLEACRKGTKVDMCHTCATSAAQARLVSSQENAIWLPSAASLAA